MTHTDLVELAHRWLTKAKGCGFAFAELCASTANGEQPDAIGFRQDYTILVECKVSRADFLADKKKRFRRQPHSGMGNYRFFMAPAGLIKPDDLPEKWGLIEVSEKGKARQVVGPKGNVECRWSEWRFPEKSEMSERDLMYSALRRLNLRGSLSQIYDNPFGGES